MPALGDLVSQLGQRYGVLAESNTYQLTVIAINSDVAVGDLFLLPCERGAERFYVFRTSQYANIMNRTIEMNDVARNKLTMPDSYFSEDWGDDKLIELRGIVLGYAERDASSDQWTFHRPRRLPQHLSDVFHVKPDRPEVATVVQTLMASQLGHEGIYIGDLLAGESSLDGVPVYLPPFAFSHHIGIFGRTGCGKSNLMMVLLRSIMKHNQNVLKESIQNPPISILAIDPHDEFKNWHLGTGGADGLHGIVSSYSDAERRQLVEPFYYLTAKGSRDTGLERRIRLSRADVIPADLISVMEFTEQQVAFAHHFYAQEGEEWITRLLMDDVEDGEDREAGAAFQQATISAVQRRLNGLVHGNTRVFTRFDPERVDKAGRQDSAYQYDSTLADIICSLEQGRVVAIDTTLMTELDQFLVTTVVGRVLFSLRRAMRSAGSSANLETSIRQSLGNDTAQGQVGMQHLADELVQRLRNGRLPYLTDGEIRPPDQLPYVNVVVEEAPSILNPERMRFGSVFRDISRQGRKFGIGLTVISQQVSEIDHGVLTQLNTELTMSLGNEGERREAIRNASADLFGFERELQVMGRGQVIVSASYKDIPMPVCVPAYDAE
jgi:hypothetical protein